MSKLKTHGWLSDGGNYQVVISALLKVNDISISDTLTAMYAGKKVRAMCSFSTPRHKWVEVEIDVARISYTYMCNETVIIATDGSRYSPNNDFDIEIIEEMRP